LQYSNLCVLFFDNLVQGLNRSQGNAIRIHERDVLIILPEPEDSVEILRHRANVANSRILGLVLPRAVNIEHLYPAA
jgi:hypothetical protein